MKLLCVVPCSPYFPSGIVRVEQYIPLLRTKGITVECLSFKSARVQRWLEAIDRTPLGTHRRAGFPVRAAIHASGLPHEWLCAAKLLTLAPHYDALLINDCLLPKWAVQTLVRRNPNLIFDFDDAIYLRNPTRAAEIARQARALTPGSHALLEYAQAHNACSVLIPSSVPVNEYRLPGPPPSTRPVRIGWIGSVSTLKYLHLLVDPLQRLVERGVPFELFLAGARGRKDLVPQFPGIKVIEVPSYTNAEIPGLVEQFEIGIMPLTDGPWERGKCAMKAVICMAGGKPVVCSPVGESSHIVQDGVNGFLPGTNEAWGDVLAELIGDAALRMRVGMAGRRTVEEFYSTRGSFEKLMRVVIG